MTQIPQISDTNAFMEKFLLLIDAGETLSLPVLGNSMSPFLVHQRDSVYLKRPDRPLKVGDIVLYRRKNGSYILHRIHSVKNGRFTMVGDAHTILEPDIEEYQIRAIAVRACRKGVTETPGSFWWEFFARIWIRSVPLRPGLHRIYGTCSKLMRR